jgi:hypothetical protein
VPDRRTPNGEPMRPATGSTPTCSPEQGDAAGMRAAKFICAGCAVCAARLDYVLENHERKGVWGGTAAKQRRRIYHLRRWERTGGHRADPVSA